MTIPVGYHQEFPRETHCDDCGEIANCSIYVADYPERETGYVDSRAICATCEVKRGLI